jgi:hypothetical protein
MSRLVTAPSVATSAGGRSVKADHAQRVDLVVSSAFEWYPGDHSATYSASAGR